MMRDIFSIPVSISEENTQVEVEVEIGNIAY